MIRREAITHLSQYSPLYIVIYCFYSFKWLIKTKHTREMSTWTNGLMQTTENDRNHLWEKRVLWPFRSVHVPSIHVEEAGFKINSEASHQGAIKIFGFTLRERSFCMKSIVFFSFQNLTHHIWPLLVPPPPPVQPEQVWSCSLTDGRRRDKLMQRRKTRKFICYY